MTGVMRDCPTGGSEVLQSIPEITRTINGYHVTIRFSPNPDNKIMETVKHILTLSYIDQLNKCINENMGAIKTSTTRKKDRLTNLEDAERELLSA
jgi:hypothetical protein